MAHFSNSQIRSIESNARRIYEESKTPLQKRIDSITRILAQRNAETKKYEDRMAQLDAKIASVLGQLHEDPKHTKYVKTSGNGSGRKHITTKTRRPCIHWSDGTTQFLKDYEVQVYQDMGIRVYFELEYGHCGNTCKSHIYVSLLKNH